MAIGFKKRTKRAAPNRKRTHDAVDDDDEAAADATEQPDVTLQTIEEVLEEQRLRSRGVLPSEPSVDKRAKKKPKATATTEPEVQYGIHDPKKDGATGQKLLQLLDGQFTGQTGATQQEQHQELMHKYIEERLHKTETASASASATASTQASTAAGTDQDDLFAELKTQLEAKRGIENADKDKDDETADGGVLIWNTGIAEVDLPSSFYERTVEETRRALAQANQNKSRHRIASSALPNNFSVDFNRQRTEYIQELKAMSKDEKRERGVVMQGRRDQPSDDLAVSRFRRMESRRRHH